MMLSNGYVACQVSAEMDSSSTGGWDCISSVCNSAWLRIIKRGAEKTRKTEVWTQNMGVLVLNQTVIYDMHEYTCRENVRVG